MPHVAIIGGGPAGATAARAAARAGFRVTVWEERCGWEKPCGGGLTYKALRRYPFLGEAVEPHTALHEVEFLSGRGQAVRFRLAQPLLIYSRAVLNRLLVRRAAEAGAELIEDHVLGFHREGSGWRLESRGGQRRADYLVLAAGARSQLRGLLAPLFEGRDFMLTFGYYTPLADPLRARGLAELVRVQFFEDFEGYAWAFPRPDHLSVGICGKVGEYHMADLRARLEDFAVRLGYWRPSATAAERGPVFSHVLAALTEERWRDLRLAGRGWALAGDAAGLVDPVTGEGIYFAMRSGDLLAEALLEGAPQAYPQRVWREFGQKLARGARLAHPFYHGKFLGDFSTTRLVQLAARSPSFLRLLENLIEGSRSYPGWRGQVYGTFAKAALEISVQSARHALRSSSVVQRERGFHLPQGAEARDSGLRTNDTP